MPLSKKICVTKSQVHTFIDYVYDIPAYNVNKRRVIINIFVHLIYLYDDYFTLIVNAIKKLLSIDNIPLDEIETSFSGDTYISDECSSVKTPAPPMSKEVGCYKAIDFLIYNIML